MIQGFGVQLRGSTPRKWQWERLCLSKGASLGKRTINEWEFVKDIQRISHE